MAILEESTAAPGRGDARSGGLLPGELQRHSRARPHGLRVGRLDLAVRPGVVAWRAEAPQTVERCELILGHGGLRLPQGRVGLQAPGHGLERLVGAGEEANLADLIVVFDDPMTSLDLKRSQAWRPSTG